MARCGAARCVHVGRIECNELQASDPLPPRQVCSPPSLPPAPSTPTLSPAAQDFQVQKLARKKEYEAWLATQPYDDEE